MRILEILQSRSFIVHRAASFRQILFIFNFKLKKITMIYDRTIYDERT